MKRAQHSPVGIGLLAASLVVGPLPAWGVGEQVPGAPQQPIIIPGQQQPPIDPTAAARFQAGVEARREATRLRAEAAKLRAEAVAVLNQFPEQLKQLTEGMEPWQKATFNLQPRGLFKPQASGGEPAAVPPTKNSEVAAVPFDLSPVSRIGTPAGQLSAYRNLISKWTAVENDMATYGENLRLVTTRQGGPSFNLSDVMQPLTEGTGPSAATVGVRFNLDGENQALANLRTVMDTEERQVFPDSVEAVRLHWQPAIRALFNSQQPSSTTGQPAQQQPTNTDAGHLQSILQPPETTQPTSGQPAPKTKLQLSQAMGESVAASASLAKRKLAEAGLTLNGIQEKLDAAGQKEAQAQQTENSAPQGSGGGGQPQQQAQSPQSGSPSGGQGNQNNNGGGQASAGDVPFGKGFGDGRGLLGINSPNGPSVDSVAAASQVASRPNPRFEPVPGNTAPPSGILKSTAGSRTQPTSGQPPVQASNNIIPGNSSTGSPLSPNFFANNDNGAGAAPGGAAPGTNSTGGVAGGAFGGADIGTGIGPSYGGRAGLSDALKTVAYVGGGGTAQGESTATIATGADIPAGLAGQIVGGKPMKQPPGKGMMGLMGQVYSLIQTQCMDAVQKNVIKDFCSNASQVAAREEMKVASTASRNGGSRAVTGNRAPASVR